MIRAVCEGCGARQPPEWKPGETCTSCGAAVRRDVRCAWCVKWTPAGRFCRGCGCELVPDARFGAGRMLKEAGVDRLSLAKRLAEMDPEQVDNFQRIYEEQRAIVNRRVEEAALCESFLLSRGFAARLEDELIEAIPAPAGALEALAEGPKGPFAGRADLLPEIAEGSPITSTRELAEIALLRRGDRSKERIRAVRSVAYGEGATGLEASLALAHWRIVRPEYARGTDLFALAQRASAVLDQQPWRAAAAVACGNVRVWMGDPGARGDHLRAQYRRELEGIELGDALDRALAEAIDDADPDVRFQAALALMRTDRLVEAARGGDAEMREAANALLARTGAPDAARALREGTDEDRLVVLQNLRDPGVEMVEPLLAALERGNERIREKAAWALANAHEKIPGLLDDRAVDRMLAVAERTNHSDVLKAMLFGETMPGIDRIARAAFRTELHRGMYVKDSLKRAAKQKRLTPAVLGELLDEAEGAGGGEGAREVRALAILPVVESCLDETKDRALLKRVIRLFIRPGSVKLRHDACWVLRRVHGRGDQGIVAKPVISRASVDENFGSAAAFLADLTNLLEDHEALLEVGVYDSVSDMLGYDVDEGVFPLLWDTPPGMYRRFLEAVLGIARNEKLWAILRGNAIKFLEKAADHPDHREWVAAEVETTGNPGDYWTKRVVCTLRGLPRD